MTTVCQQQESLLVTLILSQGFPLQNVYLGPVLQPLSSYSGFQGVYTEGRADVLVDVS